jgi:hypothetical protein
MPAESKAQQKFFGIVHGMQKGTVPKSYSPKAAKAAKTIEPKAAKEFAATKMKGLPKHTIGGLKKTQVKGY